MMRTNTKAMAVILSIWIGLILLSNVTSCKSAENPIPKIGEHAPDFSLDDFNGEKFSLSEELTNNKAIILWFTNLCEGCLKKMPEMEMIKNMYEKKGIEVAAISVLGEERNIVENAIQQNKATFRFLYDPKGKVTKSFSGEYHPGTCPLQNIFIIEKNGKILFAGHYPGTGESVITEHLRTIILR